MGPEAGGSRRVRRGLVIALVAVGMLVVGVAVLAVLWFRSGARELSVEEARERFREERPSGPGGAAPLRPAEGVYAYRGSGSERISVPPKSQDQGPRMPGTVTHRRGDCWDFRIDYSTNHWQTWRYCSRDGSLVEQGGQTFQRWDLVVTTIENLSDFHCDPPAVTIRPDVRPGDVWRQSCRGTNDQIEGTAVSAGPYRFVGEERVRVGERRVAALHFVQRRTVTGAQSGTQRAELWFGLDGLPLRNERRNEVRTHTPLGVITYTEEGEFALVSLRPRA